MITRDVDEYVIAVRLNGAWKPMYVFDLKPQYPVDYDMANHYVARHPESLFVHNLMLGRAEAGTRHALVNRDYTRYGPDGTKTERRLDDADDFIAVLADAFQIRLADGETLAALRHKFDRLA